MIGPRFSQRSVTVYGAPRHHSFRIIFDAVADGDINAEIDPVVIVGVIVVGMLIDHDPTSHML